MKCAASNKSMIERIRDEERQTAIHVIVTTVAVTAFDKCGLCKKTVEKLLLGAIDQADSINKGYIKLSDLEDAMKEEHDFQIRFTSKIKEKVVEG